MQACVAIQILPPVHLPSVCLAGWLAHEVVDLWPHACLFPPQNKFPHRMVKDLQKVVEQDPLAQLDEQDKELIWKMRSGGPCCYWLLLFSLLLLLLTCVLHAGTCARNSFLTPCQSSCNPQPGTTEEILLWSALRRSVWLLGGWVVAMHSVWLLGGCYVHYIIVCGCWVVASTIQTLPLSIDLIKLNVRVCVC